MNLFAPLKTTFFAIIFLAMSSATFGQTKTDFVQAMEQFQHHYNLQHKDSICYLCSNPVANKQTYEKDLEYLFSQYGQMKSFSPAAEDVPVDGVYVFRTNFTNSTQLFGITLNKEKKIQSFKVIPSGDGVDNLKKRRR